MIERRRKVNRASQDYSINEVVQFRNFVSAGSIFPSSFSRTSHSRLFPKRPLSTYPARVPTPNTLRASDSIPPRNLTATFFHSPTRFRNVLTTRRNASHREVLAEIWPRLSIQKFVALNFRRDYFGFDDENRERKNLEILSLNRDWYTGEIKAEFGTIFIWNCLDNTLVASV